MGRPLIQLLRLPQWTKNLVVFFGIIFSGRLFEGAAEVQALLAFAAFCAAASGVYVINDVIDRTHDAQNPKKKNRPLAAGTLTLTAAWTLMGVLFVGALIALRFLPPGCGVVLALYILNNIQYSLWSKHWVILDILSISFGFILRTLMGIYAISEIPTLWILVCIFFLSIFLAFGKRRGELIYLAAPSEYRPVLEHYTVEFLNLAMFMSACMAMVSYSLFTVLSGKNPALVLTLPNVVYGIFYYLHLVINKSEGDEPEKVLFHHPALVVNLLIWFLLFGLMQYADVVSFEVM